MEFVQWNDNLLQLVNDVITRLSFDLTKQTIKWNKFCCYTCFNFNEDTKNGHLQVQPSSGISYTGTCFFVSFKIIEKEWNFNQNVNWYSSVFTTYICFVMVTTKLTIFVKSDDNKKLLDIFSNLMFFTFPMSILKWQNPWL